MLNNIQPKEPISHDERFLNVVAVWHTIQGEGPFSGFPAVFVRLAGCNLQCPLCDTNYTAGAERRHFGVVGDSIRQQLKEHPTTKLIVITGGEPFRQSAALWKLLCYLEDNFVQIQIETNGTIYPHDDFPWRLCSVVCSPKTTFVPSQLKSKILAYKYVLSADSVADDGLPATVLGYKFKPARPHFDDPSMTYLHPADEKDEEKNRANIEAVANSCMKFGYRMGIQLHKVASIS